MQVLDQSEGWDTHDQANDTNEGMELIYWAVAILVVLLGLYLYGTWTYGYFSKRHISFDSPLPFLGNMGPLLLRTQNMAHYVHNMYDKHKSNKLCGFYEFRRPLLLVCDPDMIKMITVKDAEYFIDHRSVVTEDMEPLLGKGLVSLEGQRWKDMRSTLSPAFTSSKMKAMFFLVKKCGEQMADYLEKKCEENANGMESLEMKEFYTRYTNDVIATSAFGVHVDSLSQPDNEFYDMGRVASKVTGARLLVFLGYMLFPKLMKILDVSLFPRQIKKFFRSLIHDTLETREKEGIVRPDMIHLLMQARKGTLTHDDLTDVGEEKKGGKLAALTEDDITANALLFFIAGFDTSSTLLCFMSHLLAVHPDIQRRVQQEMDEVLQENDGEITYEGVQNMKYLDMVVSESLRMYPPAILTDRKCIKPYVLAATDNSPSYKINKGDGIWIPIYPMHRDPEFFPYPDKFDPERFNDVNKHNIRPFTYLPFGAGPRNCIGMRFALMEAKIAMVCLLSRFNMEVVAKTCVPLVLDRKNFAMTPEGGFWLGFKPRTSK